jgi:hypothetical protein
MAKLAREVKRTTAIQFMGWGRHDGQKPRPLQEKGTTRSRPHSSQWTRRKP